MKSILRALPGLITTFVLGAMVTTAGFAQQTSQVVRAKEIGGVIAAGVLLTLAVIFLTRGKPQQQNTGFGSPARARNGR